MELSYQTRLTAESAEDIFLNIIKQLSHKLKNGEKCCL